MKKNAKEYVLEYLDKHTLPRWLQDLIKTIIENNRPLSNEEKNKIFITFSKENKLSIDEIYQSTTQEDASPLKSTVALQNSKLTFKKITHNMGVNALIKGESILLSPACTVLYGLNGTGKSGYFRILNELCGGKLRKNILGNIHSNEKGISVNIDYCLNNETQPTLHWADKKDRGFSHFTKARVFDSEYLPLFLDERESSVKIEPFNLELFKYIVQAIDELKLEIEKENKKLKQKLMDLDPLIEELHSDFLQKLITETTISKENLITLDKYKDFLPEDALQLSELQKEVKKMESNDFEATELLLENEIEGVIELKENLQLLKNIIEVYTEKAPGVIEDYLKKKKNRNAKLKQFNLLKGIPALDSGEWQEFISSSEEYRNIISEQDFDTEKTCIYCHQPLGQSALKIINAYSQYLNDSSQLEYSESEDALEALKNEIEEINTALDIDKNLSKLFLKEKDKTKKDYNSIVKTFSKIAKEQQRILLENIANKNTEPDTFSLSIVNFINKLDSLINERENKLKNIHKKEELIATQISTANSQIEFLKDKKNISKWYKKITNNFLFHKNIRALDMAIKTINTSGITRLSGEAHERLLTETIRNAFIEELSHLGQNIGVELRKVAAGKGIVLTGLEILGNDVKQILSEGEQKKISLALFLAEAIVDGTSDPIIFDDPVTSLDHEIADILAKRLLLLSCARQIIIFTHNKYFYDSILYWANNLKDETGNIKLTHLCKNYEKGCNSKSHHIFTYKVEKISSQNTGAIRVAPLECCQHYITLAESDFQKRNFESIPSKLKTAIEHYIDEKVMLNLPLMKDRKTKENIEWDKLKTLKTNPSTIDTLKKYYGILSNRGTHLTGGAQDNPIRPEELTEIINFLKCPE